MESETTPVGEYVFSSLEKVTFGPGSLSSLPEEIDLLQARHVLLVSTRSLANSAALSAVREALGPRLVGIFTNIPQHTPASSVVALTARAQSLHADALVSLGGGSVIDATKAAVLALARDTGHFLAHVSIPTTLSASEFSPLFGITDEATHRKTGGSNPFVVPQFVILDAQLTAETPDWLWKGSGARALDHAVETVYAPNHQPATDAAALEAIRLLFHHLPLSTRPNSSLDARQHCQLAAWLSFFGISNITLGLSHALGRELGPRYDIPHGYTSAILLPRVMAFLLPQTTARQALIARAAGEDTGDRSEGELALEAPTRVSTFMGSLGLPQRLREVGVPETDLPDLAAGRGDVLKVLHEAW